MFESISGRQTGVRIRTIVQPRPRAFLKKALETRLSIVHETNAGDYIKGSIPVNVLTKSAPAVFLVNTINLIYFTRTISLPVIHRLVLVVKTCETHG